MSNAKKMVLKVAIEDKKSKRKALKTVAGVVGVESVAVDMKERKLTVIGEAEEATVLLYKNHSIITHCSKHVRRHSYGVLTIK